MQTNLLLTNIAYIYGMFMSLYYIKLMFDYVADFIMKIDHIMNIKKTDIAYLSVYIGIIISYLQKV